MSEHSFNWNRVGARLTVLALCTSLLSLGATLASAQERPANRANWKLANRFTPESLRPFLYSSSLTPGWINKKDKFWYSWRDSSGTKYWLVDCKAKKKEPLFDSDKMAALLSESLNRPIDATTLNVTQVTFDEKNDDLMRFVAESSRFEYDRKSESLKSLGRATTQTPPAGGPPGGGGGGGQGFPGAQQNRDFRNYSPDKKAFVYAMDHNLYYVAVVDGKEQEPKQLTTDGATDYSFGSRSDTERFQQMLQGEGVQVEAPPANERRVRANVTWSKDSKRFFVMRSDSRKVKDLFLVNSLSEPRPTLLTYKYPMPGEVDVTQLEVFALDPEKIELVKLPVEKYKDQRLFDMHWQDQTSDSMRFVRRDRLQRNLELCEIDLKTLKITPLLTEKVENAFLESQSVRYIKPGGDFLWFSERTGWGHYYLYSNDGKLKRAVTSGPWRADAIVDVDAEKGVMWFRGQGREANENPYYQHLYRTQINEAKGVRLLNPGNSDNTSALSPTKEFIVNTASRIDMPSTVSLFNADGEEVMKLEQMDVSRLMAAGWRMPEAFVVKAADGVTNIYGNLWKPSDFDARRKYPIIANVYPGPQTESVTSTFSATATNQRLAQLGFIVIQIGNRGGNPARSNAYHSYGYYNLRDYGLADKKAGIEELALRYPWIDVDRVGIYGHSGGGFMTAAALLLPPYNDFFTVGVSSAGNHDNNVYNQNWSEQHHGLREVVPNTTGRTSTPDPLVDDLGDAWAFPDEDPQRRGAGGQGGGQTGQGGTQGQGATGQFQIKVPTNHELAANLKGHLLLVHGDMDNNVHPAGTIRLVNALIRANKRFDFMVMPGKAHGFADMQPYFTQMLMEYFAEHLLGDYYRGSSQMDDKSGSR